MKKVRMTRIAGGSALRTSVIEGETTRRLPNIGQQFRMTGVGLEFGTRMVNTSPVVSFTENTETGAREITTESGSVYLLEFI